MKKIKLIFGLLLFAFFASLTSCSSDDSSAPVTEGPINTGPLRLFLIDTAKINTISSTGTNETTIVNKMVNLNSYIGRFALAPDGTKFAYSNHQSSGTFPNTVYLKEIRMANSDGTNDISIYSSTDNQMRFGAIKIGNNNKVYFVTINSSNTKTVNSVNFDGSGIESFSTGFDIVDVSNDGNLLATEMLSSPTQNTQQIIDRNGDNGAGGLYHNEVFTLGSDHFSEAIFTRDGKSLVVAYLENQTIKVRIIDLATKTSVTKNLISGFTETFFGISLSMASDSNRGVITIATYDDAPSKTYLFNLETATVEAPFNNNDDNIFDVYAH